MDAAKALKQARVAAVSDSTVGKNPLLCLLQDGHITGIIEHVESLNNGFFKQRPDLLFELKRCVYAAKLKAGDLAGALAVARAELAPLAEATPALQPALKASMSALLPGAPTEQALPQLGDVVGMVASALQARLGLQGPRLVNVLQVGHV